MTVEKAVEVAAGGAMVSLGVAAKVADLGLTVAEIVPCGMVNTLTNQFVNAPDLKIGEPLLKEAHKGVKKASSKLLKEGKGLLR